MAFCDLLLIQDTALAGMTDTYPKRLSFTGVAELTYKDYTAEANGLKNGYSTLEQRYNLGVKGYIYNPKLAVFNARVTFVDENTVSSTANFKPNSKSINYELSAVFLPYRPVSLTAYATRADFTVSGLPGGGSPYDMTIMNYGALLTMTLKNLPTVRFEYYHLDITPTGTQQNRTATTNDSFYLNVRGNLNSLKMQYSVNVGFSDIRTQTENSQIKFIDVYTHKDFKKFSLINYFRYYDQSGLDHSQIIGIYSNIIFDRGQRFVHEYFYSFEHTEETFNKVLEKSDRHDLRGNFNYRIFSNLSSSATLNYGLVKDDIGHFKYYAVNTTLNYSRPVKSLYLVSYYRFILRNDEEHGNFTEHTVNLDLTSRQLKGGRLYMSYNFTLLDGTFKMNQDSGLQSSDGLDQNPQDILAGKYKTMTHTLLAGFRGRAFARATWSVEAEYINSSSNKERPKINFGFNEDNSLQPDILQTERKSNYYILVGELLYPLGRRGTSVALRTGYNVGESDSRKINKFYYEIRGDWPVSRRLHLLAWWREAWYKIQANPNTSVREYNILANYRMGRLFLDAEYWVRDQVDTGNKTDTRLIVKAKRFF